MMKIVHSGIAAVCAVLALTTEARATLIDVQFNPSYNYTGAAVIGSSGDKWNQITSASASNVTLVNSSNSVTSVQISLSGFTGTYGGNSNEFFDYTSYATLMTGYAYMYMGTAVATISGLTANGWYELIAYNSSDSLLHFTNFTVNGTTLDTVPADVSTFQSGVNYVTFPMVQANASGVLNLDVTEGPGADEGDLDAFQLTNVPAPIPEPATLTLAPAVGFVLALCRRSQRSGLSAADRKRPGGDGMT